MALGRGVYNLDPGPACDPYLGRVIRGPGEDYLQQADFLEIVQSAKAEAEESAQKSRTSRR